MEGFSVTTLEAACLGVSAAVSVLSFYLYKKSRTTVDKLDVSCEFCVVNFIYCAVIVVQCTFSAFVFMLSNSEV